MKHKTKKRSILKVIILILIIAFVGCGVNNYLQYNLFYPLKHYDTVKAQAEKYDLDPFLIMAVIKAESNFKADAVSNKDASGLMQITPSTAHWIAEQMEQEISWIELESPATNITLGVWYVDYLLDYYDGHTQLALAAYNAGTGTVDRWLKDNKIQENGNVITLPFKETTDYLVKINTYYKRYKQLYEKGNKLWWSFS